MPLKCAVVDDSMIQRLYICKLIQNHPSLTLVADLKSALEAKTVLKNKQIDLLFIDIEMPVFNGFDLLDMLKTKPQIIFVTNKPNYLAKAKVYKPTDFISKPMSLERLNEAVEKALRYHELLQVQKKQNIRDFITLKYHNKYYDILFNDIKWIEALGDYVKIVTQQKTLIVHQHIDSLEEQLPCDKFLRALRSHIINTDELASFKLSQMKAPHSGLWDTMKSFFFAESHALAPHVYAV